MLLEFTMSTCDSLSNQNVPSLGTFAFCQPRGDCYRASGLRWVLLSHRCHPKVASWTQERPKWRQHPWLFPFDRLTLFGTSLRIVRILGIKETGERMFVWNYENRTKLCTGPPYSWSPRGFSFLSDIEYVLKKIDERYPLQPRHFVLTFLVLWKHLGSGFTYSE